MTIPTNDGKAGWPGSPGGAAGEVSPLQQILEKNIDRINEGHVPGKTPWQNTEQPGRKPRPLRTILSSRLDEIDSSFQPLSSPQEIVKGLEPDTRPGQQVFPVLAQNRAGGAPAGFATMSDHDFAQQGSGYGRRVGNSLHTGDTRGGNDTFHTVQTDPAAREIVEVSLMDGQHPEDYGKYIRDVQALPHNQIGVPLATGAMTGVAHAVTPTVELGAQGVNAIYGETAVGKDLADFRKSVQELEDATDESIRQYSRLSQNGKLTPLGQAVKQGSKFTGSLAENAITRTVPAMGVLNHLYDAKQAWQQAYRKKSDELEASESASGERHLTAEKESLAYREALLDALAQLMSPAPFFTVKKSTRVNTDSSLTTIAQDAIGDQAVPHSRERIRQLLDNLIHSSQWDKDHF